MNYVLLIVTLSFCSNPFAGDSYTAGYVNVNRNAQLFYWLQYARAPSASPPLILWLQGGPGCSSMIDQFTDIGAFNVHPNGTIYNNPYAWNTFANLLFVDQPVCTGLSFCTDISQSPKNEQDVAADLFMLVKGVMNLNPSLKGSPLYISGHSYGGHYVPAAARYFIEMKDPDVSLNGISIGDGWYSMQAQGPAYSTFSEERGLSNSFISFASYAAFTIANLFYSLGIDFTAMGHYFIAGKAMIEGLNPRFCLYNYEQKVCPSGAVPQVSIILNSADARSALNITSSQPYEICSDAVGMNMEIDYLNSSIPDLEFVLKNGIKTILYVGRKDWVCNENGMDNVLRITQWPYSEEFNSTEYIPYYVNGAIKGIQKSAAYLTYIKLTNCGHGVEQDDQEAAFDIMDRLIN